MTSKQKILLSIAVLIIFSMLLFILFGDHGLADLNMLKKERARLVESSERLADDNLLLYNKINRLKNDPVYIENVARQELGMIGKDEVILKFQQPPISKPANSDRTGNP
jgi:cell division protein FtsB